MVADTNNATKNLDISINGLDKDLAYVRHYNSSLENGANFASIMIEKMEWFRGLFLGAQAQAGNDAIFQIQTSNVNAATLFATAGGYVWSPRSINAPGGPIRYGVYRP